MVRPGWMCWYGGADTFKLGSMVERQWSGKDGSEL